MASLDLTTLAIVKQHMDPEAAMDTSRDAFINQLIDEVSDQVELFTGRQFLEAARTEYYDGTGTDTLILNQGPLVSVTSVHSVEYGDNGSGTRTETLTAVDQADRLEGGLRTEGAVSLGWLRMLSGVWARGKRNYKVVYTAGFATATSGLPLSIVSNATTEVAIAFNLRASEGLMSKTQGDGGIAPAPRLYRMDAMERAFSQYRARRFAA